MLIGVIQVTELTETLKQLKAATMLVDVIELRLDYQQTLDFASLADLRHHCDLPIIMTLRKSSQGGHYQHSEEERLADLMQLCTLQPDYMDLEFDTSKDAMKAIHTNFPQIKLICSYHDFAETPADLNVVLQGILNPWCQIYKIATKANSICDALRMLQFLSKQQKTPNQAYRVSGLCMGELGVSTRILGPIFDNALNYASLNSQQQTAPGQLTINELLNIYHYRQLNKNTKIYALLGDPVWKSVGHIVHNKAYEILANNAVYIKLPVPTAHLGDAMTMIRTLPFVGFSITMPLKEIMIHSVDRCDAEAKKIGAINTIYRQDQQYIGCNTDGEGALLALSQKINVNKKTIVILGAGGAAKAIAFAVSKAGANVVIVNRTHAKGLALAEMLNGKAYELNNIHELQHYDVIINTLPLHLLPPDEIKRWLVSDIFLTGKIAMDIVYIPIITPFLAMAKKANCICVPGYEMYIQQALLQIKFWFSPSTIKMQQLQNMMQQLFTAENNINQEVRQ